jgi:hypothetical protein
MYVPKITVTRFYCGIHLGGNNILMSELNLNLTPTNFWRHYEFMGSKQSNITRIPSRVIQAKAY